MPEELPSVLERPAPEKPPEEKVLMVSKISRRAYLFPHIIAVLLIALPLPFSMFNVVDIILDPIIYIVLGILILAVMEVFLYTRDELHVTDRTITEKKGILSRHVLTVDYNDISAITVKQGIIARLLGYGKLIINIMASSEPITFSKISNPIKVKQVIEEQIRKSTSQPSPRTPAYPQPAPSLPPVTPPEPQHSE